MASSAESEAPSNIANTSRILAPAPLPNDSLIGGRILSPDTLRRRLSNMMNEPYPELPRRESVQRPNGAECGWRACGVRFAPLHIPFTRRAQSLAVFLHCTLILLVVSTFFLLCANPFLWPLIIVYLLRVAFSNVATDGRLRNRSEWLRSSYLWTLFAGYFPARLHKTFDLPADRRYIFGYHPHGIISHGAWVAFATEALGFAQKFPGIVNSMLTLDSNFRLPFYRDFLLAMGLRSVSKESITNTLKQGGPQGDGTGRAVTIVIGGARESLEARPGTMRLIISRKGFVRVAIRSGADLVPVLAFGENNLYNQLNPTHHPIFRRFQMFILRVFKFTLPMLQGRGLLNYDVGLMPYRHPLDVVVGRPIRIEQSATPAQEDIDRYHELYVAELRKIWEAYKDIYAPDRTMELEFI